MLATFFAVVLLVPSIASAEIVTGLEVDYGNVDPALEQELHDALVGYFEDSSRYEWLPTDEALEQLDEEHRGCFEELCLLQISQRLEAAVGLTIQLDVEHEIYEWTVEFYNLLEGRHMTTEEGICELCGRAEVTEQFRASIAGPMSTMDVETSSDSGEDEPEQTEETEEAAEPAARVTEVRFTTIPEDAEIHVDEERIGRGEATVELGEGIYDVRFTHDSHHTVTDRISISENPADRLVVRVHLPGAEGEPREIPVRDEGFVDGIGSGRSVLGWSFLGVGVASVSAAVALAYLDGRPTCGGDTELRDCPDLYATAGWATAAAALGAVGITGGTTLLVWPFLAGRKRPPIRVGVDEPDGVRTPTVGLGITGWF